MRGVVLETTVARRVVAGRDDDAVGQSDAWAHVVDGRELAAVGGEDRVRDRRGRRVTVLGVDEDGHAARDEHLDRAGPGRLGQPVRVASEEERPVEALALAVVADGLGRGDDVVLVEGGVEAAAAVSRGPEGDLLVDVLGVRLAGVVGGDEVGDVDEVGGLGEVTGARAAHGPHPCTGAAPAHQPARGAGRQLVRRALSRCLGDHRREGSEAGPRHTRGGIIQA